RQPSACTGARKRRQESARRMAARSQGAGLCLFQSLDPRQSRCELYQLSWQSQRDENRLSSGTDEYELVPRLPSPSGQASAANTGSGARYGLDQAQGAEPGRAEKRSQDPTTGELPGVSSMNEKPAVPDHSTAEEQSTRPKEYWRSLDDLADTPEFREF